MSRNLQIIRTLLRMSIRWSRVFSTRMSKDHCRPPFPKSTWETRSIRKECRFNGKKDIVQYATSVADYGMPIASYGWKNEEYWVFSSACSFFLFFCILETYASAIETRDHTASFQIVTMISEFYLNFVIDRVRIHCWNLVVCTLFLQPTSGFKNKQTLGISLNWQPLWSNWWRVSG